MATNTYYGQYWLSLANKEIDMDGDALKAMLVTSAYTFNKDTHRYKSSITNEVVGTGYAGGGLIIPSPSITYDSANGRVKFSGGNLSWTGATLSARGAVVYDSTPASDATRPLIMFINFGLDLSPVNGTLALTWDALGMGYVNS